MSKFVVWLRDTGEQSGKAFVAAFLGTVVLRWTGTIPSLAAAEQLGMAGVAAGVTAALGVLGSRFGNRTSPSFQPDLPAVQVAADPKVTP